MKVDLAPSRSDHEDEGQATYGMANLRPERTGLSFIVFISQRDDAKHAARVKVAPAPRVQPDAMGSYAIEPFAFKAGRPLSPKEERRLATWIETNRAVIQDYWDGVIEYTEDALSLLKKV